MALKNKFGVGVRKEKVVKKKLERLRWKVEGSQASRGASDLIATKDGRKWYVSVKSTSKSKQPPVGAAEKRRLKIQASRGGGIPVRASVTRGLTVKFISLRTNRKLRP
jgi:hypothetical protein